MVDLKLDMTLKRCTITIHTVYFGSVRFFHFPKQMPVVSQQLYLTSPKGSAIRNQTVNRKFPDFAVSKS